MFTPIICAALARVMVAAAWINGQVDPTQEKAIRDFFSKIKGLDEGFWMHLGFLLERPMDATERLMHLRDLRKNIKDDGDLRLAQQAVNQVIIAKGQITDEERNAMQHFSRMIRASEEEVTSEMIRLIRGQHK